MRVTKVKGYSTKKNVEKGHVLDPKNDPIEQFDDFKNIEHITSHKLLNNAFEKGIKNKKFGKDNETIEINKKRIAIKAFVSNLKLEEDKGVVFNNEKCSLHHSIRKIASCDLPTEDKYGRPLTVEKIITYSFKNKSLEQFKIYELMAKLIEIYNEKKQRNEKITDDDLKHQYKTIVEPQILKHDEKVKKIFVSIEKNKIQSDDIKGRSHKRMFYEKLSHEAIDKDTFKQYIEELSEDYALEKLANTIKTIQQSEGYKKQTRIEQNKMIKSTLQAHQKELYTASKFYDDIKQPKPLKFYNDELVAYFHRHFPIKRKQRITTRNHDDIDYVDVNKIKKEIQLQMRNKLITHLITQGKYKLYTKANNMKIEELESNDLEIMHIEDVFSRKLSSTITYAVNSFRNELFGEYQYKYLEESIDKKFLFFNEPIGSEVFNETLRAKMKSNQRNEIIKELETFKKYGYYISDINELIDKIKNDSENLVRLTGDVFNIINQYNKLQTIKSTLMNDIKGFQNKDFLSEEEEGKIRLSFKDMYSLNRLKKFKKNNGSGEVCELSPKLYDFTRKAMFAFRNTSFHYQPINTSFLKSGKEEADYLNDKVIEKIIYYFRKHIDDKVAIIPEMEISKAYDNSVFHYFDFNDIYDLYNNNDFWLPRTNEKMPQFKKVINTIKNIIEYSSAFSSHQKQNIKKIYDLIHQIEEKKEFKNNQEISKRHAVKYLLLKIYQNKTTEIKKEALKKLKKFSYDKGISKSVYFDEIKEIAKNKTLQEEDYENLMIALQKDKAIYEKEKGETSHLTNDFINELTAIGFLKELEKDEYQFIFSPNKKENVIKKEILNEFEKYKIDASKMNTLKINHDEQEPLFYAFYAMLLFLSKARLSEIYHNIASYQQAVSKIKPHHPNSKKLFNSIELNSVEKVMRIMMATYESEQIDIDRYKHVLKKFLGSNQVKDLKKYNPEKAYEGERQQLYIQKSKENGEKNNDQPQRLVEFKQIIEADREDLIKRYETYYEENKTSEEEVTRFYDLEKEIYYTIQNMEQLKKEIKDSKNNREKDQLKEKYTELYYIRKEYDQLKNHILFTNVSKMNRLLVDIYSKLNGFIAVGEKDLYYLKEGLEASEEDVYNYFEEDNQNIVQIIDKDIRNKIAHFEYMRKTKEVEKVTFIDQLNRLREFLSFDRKLKNAVTKSVINTFENHGYILKFKFKGHKIHAYRLVPKPPSDIYLIKDKDKYEKNKNENDKFLKMIKLIIFEAEEDNNIYIKDNQKRN